MSERWLNNFVSVCFVLFCFHSFMFVLSFIHSCVCFFVSFLAAPGELLRLSNELRSNFTPPTITFKVTYQTKHGKKKCISEKKCVYVSFPFFPFRRKFVYFIFNSRNGFGFIDSDDLDRRSRMVRKRNKHE